MSKSSETRPKEPLGDGVESDPIYDEVAVDSPTYDDVETIENSQVNVEIARKSNGDHAVVPTAPPKSGVVPTVSQKVNNHYNYPDTSDVYATIDPVARSGLSKGALDTMPPTMDYRAYIPTGNNHQVPRKQYKTHQKLIMSFEGLLLIGEILSSFLCWVLVTVWSYAGPIYRMPAQLGFAMFVFVTSFVFTITLSAILLTGADDKLNQLSCLRNAVFGMSYNAAWVALYLTAGGLTASFAVNDMTQVLGAATAFAFISLILHASHALVHFRRKFGKCPWGYVDCCHVECHIDVTRNTR
ncbi:uncharacterized protein LOC143460217 [Clavelina lepadiformis]|uniref:uncharacterized protein LOC143460217 n=1 Tax=Clavelina lepadiformis TaxID=159417 RepID=UPI0040422FAC